MNIVAAASRRRRRRRRRSRRRRRRALPPLTPEARCRATKHRPATHADCGAAQDVAEAMAQATADYLRDQGVGVSSASGTASGDDCADGRRAARPAGRRPRTPRRKMSSSSTTRPRARRPPSHGRRHHGGGRDGEQRRRAGEYELVRHLDGERQVQSAGRPRRRRSLLSRPVRAAEDEAGRVIEEDRYGLQSGQGLSFDTDEKETRSRASSTRWIGAAAPTWTSART